MRLHWCHLVTHHIRIYKTCILFFVIPVSDCHAVLKPLFCFSGLNFQIRWNYCCCEIVLATAESDVSVRFHAWPPSCLFRGANTNVGVHGCGCSESRVATATKPQNWTFFCLFFFFQKKSTLKKHKFSQSRSQSKTSSLTCDFYRARVLQILFSTVNLQPVHACIFGEGNQSFVSASDCSLFARRFSLSDMRIRCRFLPWHLHLSQ